MRDPSATQSEKTETSAQLFRLAEAITAPTVMDAPGKDSKVPLPALLNAV